MSINVNPNAAIPFEDIQFHNEIRNSRRILTNIDVLMESIRADGLRRPLLVWQYRKNKKSKSQYYLLGGFRRFEALKQLRLESKDLKEQFSLVPIVRWEGGLEDAHFQVLADNLDHDNLTQMEVADEVARLEAMDFSRKQICEKLGKDKSWVSRMLTLHKGAKTSVKESLSQGKIPTDAAQEIVKHARDEREQKILLDKAEEAAEKGESAKKAVQREVAKKSDEKPAPADEKGESKSTRKTLPRPSKKELTDALKELPEGGLDDDQEIAANAFEQALLYAMGDRDLHDALEKAGITAVSTEAKQNEEAEPEPELPDLAPEPADEDPF